MTRVVWKFSIEDTSPDFRILMPAGAKILSVQAQHGLPCIWALVDPQAPTVPRSFVLADTGGTFEVPAEAAFVGTFQLQSGLLVFHLWDMGDGT